MTPERLQLELSDRLLVDHRLLLSLDNKVNDSLINDICQDLREASNKLREHKNQEHSSRSYFVSCISSDDKIMSYVIRVEQDQIRSSSDLNALKRFLKHETKDEGLEIISLINLT